MINQKEKQIMSLKVKLQSGASFVKIRPIISPYSWIHKSKLIIIASGCDVKLYSIKSGECVLTCRYHKTPIVSLQEDKDNCLQFFSCSEDGIVVKRDINDGMVLKVYNLHMPATSFFAPTASNTFFVTKRVEDHYRLYSLVPKKKRSENIEMIIKPVLPGENTVAFACKGQFVAAIHENKLTVVQLDTKTVRRHLTGERKLTCIAAHPSEMIFVTGDDLGRAIVWSNALERTPIRSIYHWHSSSVADLTLSAEAPYFYSGGQEAALVKWNLLSNEKSICPRLGSPICRMNISSDGTLVVTAHNDNSLLIINTEKQIVQVIQGLVQGHYQGVKRTDTLPTGLLYDANNKALVLNGKEGYLQFYNVHDDKQLFDLDVAQRNYTNVPQDIVDAGINGKCVLQAALDEKGSWLATVNYWEFKEWKPEIMLKFWKYDISKQTFVLSTNILSPHMGKINCIQFKPLESSDDLPQVVTTSDDTYFRIWDQKLTSDGQEIWTNNTTKSCCKSPAGDASFSEDGSLLAIVFNFTITIWDVENFNLKGRIFRKNCTNDIQQIIFGRKSCCHLLVSHDSSSIAVWDMLTGSLQSIVNVNVQRIVGDITSEMCAAFCENQRLIFLNKTDSSEPIHTIEHYGKNPVNLLTVTDEDDDEEEQSEVIKVPMYQNLPLTPFAKLQAEKKVTLVEKHEPKDLVKSSNIRNFDEIFCISYMDPLLFLRKALDAALLCRSDK
ncbi:WD repeat-containing protein 75 [Caerostris extrusa]|uniref:WD repeat-containing protein 75 n=1 Tax=Caerostris extrusa TaxID=172846 RepID=A0AAV4RSJ0_CAEEX|nr:WD repeat-containing protein 75 [Caerostris extrusa]